jgi:hypothetical protein
LALVVETRDGGNSLSAHIYPNPWQTSTYVELEMVRTDELTIDLYDVSGKLIYATTQYLEKGTHKIEIGEQQVIQPGVYYCNISDGQQTIRKKMIKLN